MDDQPTYNVYEICKGVLWWEESFDSYDDASDLFYQWLNEVISENLNDYDPDTGDGLYFYDTVLGTVIQSWEYAAS